jgi:hypothetical protein
VGTTGLLNGVYASAIKFSYDLPTDTLTSLGENPNATQGNLNSIIATKAPYKASLSIEGFGVNINILDSALKSGVSIGDIFISLPKGKVVSRSYNNAAGQSSANFSYSAEDVSAAFGPSDLDTYSQNNNRLLYPTWGASSIPVPELTIFTFDGYFFFTWPYADPFEWHVYELNGQNWSNAPLLTFVGVERDSNSTNSPIIGYNYYKIVGVDGAGNKITEWSRPFNLGWESTLPEPPTIGSIQDNTDYPNGLNYVLDVFFNFGRSENVYSIELQRRVQAISPNWVTFDTALESDGFGYDGFVPPDTNTDWTVEYRARFNDGNRTTAWGPIWSTTLPAINP